MSDHFSVNTQIGFDIKTRLIHDAKCFFIFLPNIVEKWGKNHCFYKWIIHFHWKNQLSNFSLACNTGDKHKMWYWPAFHFTFVYLLFIKTAVYIDFTRVFFHPKVRVFVSCTVINVTVVKTQLKEICSLRFHSVLLQLIVWLKLNLSAQVGCSLCWW